MNWIFSILFSSLMVIERRGGKASEGKLRDLVLIGGNPLTLTLTINPLKTFKPDVTKYIGQINEFLVRILRSSCIRFVALHRRLFL